MRTLATLMQAVGLAVILIALATISLAAAAVGGGVLVVALGVALELRAR